MRSHSRVDLYAKVVAVAGLGCLGVAGALVDYASDVENLPPVASVLELDGAPSVLTLVDVAGFSDAGSSGMTFTLVSDRRSYESPRREFVAYPSPFRSQVVSFVNTSAAVPRRVRPLPAAMAVPELPLASARLAPPPQIPDVEAEEDTAPIATSLMAMNQQDGDAGFITSVLRKTGSSVGKAGTSLVGAFRVVGDAVKKVPGF
jgi:hypothetical protein